MLIMLMCVLVNVVWFVSKLFLCVIEWLVGNSEFSILLSVMLGFLQLIGQFCEFIVGYFGNCFGLIGFECMLYVECIVVVVELFDLCFEMCLFCVQYCCIECWCVVDQIECGCVKCVWCIGYVVIGVVD